MNPSLAAAAAADAVARPSDAAPAAPQGVLDLVPEEPGGGRDERQHDEQRDQRHDVHSGAVDVKWSRSKLDDQTNFRKCKAYHQSRAFRDGCNESLPDLERGCS